MVGALGIFTAIGLLACALTACGGPAAPTPTAVARNTPTPIATPIVWTSSDGRWVCFQTPGLMDCSPN